MLVTYFVKFRQLNDHLFGKELFIRFSASAFRKLPSIYVFSYFPFGFEGRMWDLIVSVPDHCLSFYFLTINSLRVLRWSCILRLLAPEIPPASMTSHAVITVCLASSSTLPLGITGLSFAFVSGKKAIIGLRKIHLIRSLILSKYICPRNLLHAIIWINVK